jgi:hypothetical protein
MCPQIGKLLFHAIVQGAVEQDITPMVSIQRVLMSAICFATSHIWGMNDNDQGCDHSPMPVQFWWRKP